MPCHLYSCTVQSMDQTFHVTTGVAYYRLVPILNKDLKLERDQHLFSVVSFFGFTKREESRKVAVIVEWREVEPTERRQTKWASYKILHTVVAQFKYFFSSYVLLRDIKSGFCTWRKSTSSFQPKMRLYFMRIQSLVF
jgi:hypothetical protein